MVRERLRAQFLGDLLARFGACIHHRDQLAPLHLRIFLRVEASEIADTDNRCSDFLHLAAIMPAPRQRPMLPARFEELLLPDLPERTAGPREPDTGAAAPSRGPRELMILVILLAFGLFVVPLLIWAVGSGMLGPYTNGSAFALLVDFFAGLRTGSLVYWSVVVGPYVFVMLLRLVWYFVRQSDET